ncbi:37355_t:CDS:2 [Gigaspora margarita]|uniref:37355_t:CDS:1 n=1 Tax=Gigaspora margarita TaxID=4874 RepID=A0ABN7UEM3_GIGMA|nr:37355_t:CDS:2 [Gigaspora margarita]
MVTRESLWASENLSMKQGKYGNRNRQRGITERIKTIREGSNENNETTQVDEATKAYINNTCQNTISTIIEKVKELINQQAESQKAWNEQIQQTMNNRFNQLVQMNWNNTTRQSANNQLAGNNQATNLSPVTICSAIEAREDLL